MTKEAKLFNQKYQLKISDASFVPVDFSQVISQDLAGKPKKNWKENLKRFFTTPTYLIAFLVFIAIILLAIILPAFSNWNPDHKISDLSNHTAFIENLPPTSNPIIVKPIAVDQLDTYLNLGDAIDLKVIESDTGYSVQYNAWKFLEVTSGNTFKPSTSLLGTDSAGRDFWTRTWVGTGRSIKLALIVAVVSTTIGMSIGSFIGLYVGTLIDILFMKILAIYNSIPTIVWYALILFILPPGFTALLTVFLVTSWMSGLSTARMYMWKYVNADFMKAAETVGVKKIGRIFKHALPHYLGYIAYGLVSLIPATIASEASLSFIGLSPSPEDASLGNVLNEARQSILTIHSRPMLLLLPTIIIFTLTMSLHFVAMGVNDALEPKYTRRA